MRIFAGVRAARNAEGPALVGEVVCYQGFPDELLPEALRHDNPRGLWRLVGGELSQA
ncbi:hypothetical protein ACKI2N_031215 [Cupriavidus sp. 30B13]|uniref:hypothetical protein n=1 Tax=Cupriavidus sp. 30B13 TaxID=3384241 RepID=UPI003B91B5A9